MAASAWEGNVKLTELLDAAAESACEIARGALGASHASWAGASQDALPGNLCGVYIPLLAEDLAVQLGLLATREACASLARALLGDPEAAAAMESDADVFDAVGEVTNMIAGQLKVLLAERMNISVGVPLALKGRVFSLGGSQSVYGPLTLDAYAVWLVMTGSRLSRR